MSALWLKTGIEIADFLKSKIQPNGDIVDGFNVDDTECNEKAHRIPARVLLCGLLSKVGVIKKDQSYFESALSLGKFAGKEIHKYEFYNQMLDTHGWKEFETIDAENACYAFQGLVELYLVSKDPEILALCKKCAAYFISWMYFYDIETSYNGHTRGATTCRMVDFPLAYLGASCFAFKSLLLFEEATRDPFYKTIAMEMIDCVAKFQYNTPGKPWHNGIIHALDQNSGMHWGPDREGQMDTGMTSGNALIDIEYMIAHL